MEPSISQKIKKFDTPSEADLDSLLNKKYANQSDSPPRSISIKIETQQYDGVPYVDIEFQQHKIGSLDPGGITPQRPAASPFYINSQDQCADSEQYQKLPSNSSFGHGTISNLQNTEHDSEKFENKSMTLNEPNRIPKSAIVNEQHTIPKHTIARDVENIESKSADIEYLFHESDEDDKWKTSLENAKQPLPLKTEYMMSGALSVTSAYPKFKAGTLSGVNSDPINDYNNTLFNHSRDSDVRNQVLNVSPILQKDNAKSYVITEALLESQTLSSAETRIPPELTNKSKLLSITTPTASAQGSEELQPRESRQNDYPNEFSAAEAEAILEAPTFEEKIFEDNQISRFSDKAFRKALRELNPDLPRKMQWYAWNKANSILQGDNSQGGAHQQNAATGEPNRECYEVTSQKNGFLCSCNGNTNECSCSINECRCAGCPKSNNLGSFQEVEQLAEKTDPHCLCVGETFICDKCADWNDQNKINEMIQVGTTHEIIEEGTENLSKSAQLHTGLLSQAHPYLPGLGNSQEASHTIAEPSYDSNDGSPTHGVIDNAYTRSEENDKAAPQDRSVGQDSSQGGEFQVPRKLNVNALEEKTVSTTIPAYHSNIPSRPDTPRPADDDVRQSVEPEIWPRTSFRDSTPAYEDRSLSPSPVSYVNEQDFEMHDYSPNFQRSSSISPVSYHQGILSSLKELTPKVREPAESNHQIIQDKANAPQTPSGGNTISPIKREGRRKSVVQNSKIEKSLNKSRNVTQKLGTARRVTEKKKFEEMTGTNVKEAVERIETSLQVQQQSHQDQHNDVGKECIRKEVMPRRSMRIKTLKQKRSRRELNNLF